MKKNLLLVLFCFILFGISKAQVLTESFEEAGWVIGGTSTGGNVVGAIPTSNNGVNTNWLYSVISVCSNTGTISSFARTGKGVNVRTTSSSYIITPVIKGGVASVTVWVYPSAANAQFNIGIATATNTTAVGQLSSSFSSTTASSAVSGIWTISNYSAGINMTSGSWNQLTFTANVAATDDAIIKFQRIANGSIWIDDLVVTGASASAPTVTTTAISSIGSSTATSGGNVTFDGGDPVIERGVTWSTSINPKAYPPDTTQNGTGTGSFTSSITGLSSNTLYHVRAYAINGIDTAYGADLTFTTTIPTTSFYNVAGSDITVATNWGTNPDGSGTTPANFGDDGQIFHLSNTGGTMSGSLTISGLSSKIIIENTFVASQTLTAPTDVSASGILTIQSTTNPTFGVIDTASTVNFDNAAGIASTNNFGNLGLLNGAALPVGNVGVAGSFSPGSTPSATAGSVVNFNGGIPQTIPTFIYDSLVIANGGGSSTAGSNTVVTANKGISILQNFTVAVGDTLKPRGTNGVSYAVAVGSALTVNGVLDNQSIGSVTVTGTITVISGGIYKMNAPIVGNPAGFIPAGSYLSGSNIIVLQGTPRIPATIGGNVTWSSTGAGTFLNSPTNTIGGNLTVTNGQINHGNGGTGRTLTVSGNLTVSGGRYDVLGSPGSAAANQTLIVNGNVNVTGGRLYASAGAVGTGVGTINIKGNLVHTSGLFGDSNIVNTTGLILFNGTSNQNISTIGLSDTTSITINNPAGVTLLTDLGLIAGTLTFTNGLINTGSFKVVLDSGATTIPSTTSYINGNEEKYFKTGTSVLKSFEIGDADDYAPVDLRFADITGLGSIIASTTGGDHPQIGTSTLEPSLSVNRYWTLTNNGIAFTTYDAVFNYPAGNVDPSTNTAAFIVGKNDAGVWSYPTVGTLNTTNTQITGVASFSSFAIAEETAPLPVKFEFLNGNKTTNGNKLNWKINCTSASITMQIERSTDGRNFNSIHSIHATQARCNQPFDYTDVQSVTGTNYYRLKIVDVDGKISYSSTLAITNSVKGTELVGLYPTVVRNETALSIAVEKATTINTIITDINGRLITNKRYAIAEGSNLLKIDCNKLASGVYNLTGIIEGKVIRTIRFIKL